MQHWLNNLLNRKHAANAVSFCAGALLTLGFAPFYWLPVIFICLPLPYVLLTRCERGDHVLLRGFLFGYGFFMAGTWWIGNALLVDAAKFGWMLPLSVLGLSAVMALWFLPFSYLVWRLRDVINPAIFALCWLAMELLRSIGMFGFPWNLVGYMSFAVPPLAQLAAITGVFGLSVLLVWFALLPIYWLENKPRRMLASVALSASIAIILYWGQGRLAEPTRFTNTLLRVVQPNVPQEIKGTRAGADFASDALERLTQHPPAKGRMPDIVIWPETSYPFTIRLGGPVMVPGFQGVLLTGAVRAEGYKPDVKIWNSLIALSPSGDALATYDKHQLVPFGEFVPLRSVLPLDKITPGDLDFSRGEGPKTLSLPGLPAFSPLVCYEAIFPWLAVDAKHRPEWMLNLTNDGWYGDSPGPYQHFDMVRMRAIEQGLPMVRAANSGISAVIDSKGRIVKMLPLHGQGIMDVLLPAPDSPTLFTKG